MRTVIARHEAISELCISGEHSGDCFVPRNDARLLWLIRVIVLLLFNSNTFAQSTYDNNVYHPYIKSVEFYNTAKQPSFPAINLNSSEKVLLAFDDLRGGTQDYSYTIEHCDANWNSSNL